MGMLGRASIFAALLLFKFTFVIGNIECEDLTHEDCAFAVSASGARCVLEKSILANGNIKTNCQTSFIMSRRAVEWIESDQCIRSCGLERETFGLSTDALMEAGFTDKLCSPECRNNCPNIIELYFNLAAGEGVYLPHLCREKNSRARRLIVDPVQVAAISTTQVNNKGGSLVSSLETLGPQPSPSSYGPDPAPVSFVSSQKTLKKEETSKKLIPNLLASPSPSLPQQYSTTKLEGKSIGKEDNYVT